MRKALPFLFLTLATTTTAQNWTVGVPVSEHLSDAIFTLPGTGCFPNADFAFNFPVSYVSGVQHVAIVDAVYPVNLITVVPGPVDPLDIGDTIFINAPGTREAFFPTGTGVLNLRFMAVGTPTTAGQAHPCVYNDLWLNFGLCPVTWSHSVTTTCTVQPGTVGLNEAAGNPLQVQFPTAANGWSLRITDPAVRNVEVFNASGARMTVLTTGSVACDWPEGVYFARITDAAGTRTERLAIVR